MRLRNISATLCIFILFGVCMPDPSSAFPNQNLLNLDTTPAPVQLRFPIYDRRGDAISSPSRNSFDLKQPSTIQDSIVYDPVTKNYILYEKAGRGWYRKPGFMTFDEMAAYKQRKDEVDFFQRKLNTLLNLNRKIYDPKLRVHESFFNRLFSSKGLPKVEIRPQGDLTITAGYFGQNIKNPTLPERARNNEGFDFDMQANFGLNAKIGDKLNFPITYNTLANFQFENQLKLDYTGGTDQIIKRIEAGNIAFPARGSLMPGASTLFGVKTELQFGKLYVTGVLANQNSSRQQMQMQGGTGLQNFIVKADDYEENRHFLIGQYFRNNFNKNMKNVPAITSPVQILRMEVWVTNRTGTTSENRNVVALMDLGEKKPYSAFIEPYIGGELPENNSNNLYNKLQNNPRVRDASLVTSILSSDSFKLFAVQDFERTFARKLRPEEYYFNPQIGFISLNTILQPDEVLGVAYQYSVNGKIYQVGEFSNDVTPDTMANNAGTQKVIFLKMLKATSQRPSLPIWDLMMKNVYAVGFGQLERKDFKFNILYQEPGGGEKRYFPEGDEKGRPILELVNLDRLNNQNDPQPDGVFDYIEGFTVISQQSRVIFPLLEPFGEDLNYIFSGPNADSLRKKYLFYPLYDSIKWLAQQSPQLNRFVFKGVSKSAGGNSEIPIGAFNVPQGSVTVSAGGQNLRENIDYVVDYNLGTVKIINQAIVNSGIPIQVGYENNATFGMQNRNFMGLRLDYKAIELPNRQLTLGTGVMQLSERPFFTKMNYGEDPIDNTMLGGDVNFRSDWKRLTKWLDALPYYTTRQTSTVNFYGEAARIFPSTASQIRPDGAGLIYIDDFEGSRNGIDLRFPFVAWSLASTPSKAKDPFNNILFPEAEKRDSLSYGFNRAKLAWYNIEPVLQEKNSQNNPLGSNLEELSDPRVRFVNRIEVFPQSTPDLGQNQLITFDMAFYPKERGPYNYDTRDGSIDPLTGKLNNPQKRWGGIMRAIDQIDFETNNIEFIEMWVQDPFIKQPNSNGGRLYFNLGNISEDVLKDGRRFYENGLSTTQTAAREDTSNWARVPRNPIQVAQAFSNIVEERPQQDVGFDGFTDDQERNFRSDFLNNYLSNFGNTPSYQRLQGDPSSDNYLHFRDAVYNNIGAGILARYKDFNNPHGNSPVANNEQSYTPAATLYPDNEDLNRDNTLNEMEEYFQYSVDFKRKDDTTMQVGKNFIADKREVSIRLANGNTRNETWYLFRIPIRQYEAKVRNIPDFKSIRFFRMFMTGFEDSVVLRFGKLELVRNMWRTFQYKLNEDGTYEKIDPNSKTFFNLSAVNVEENDRRSPVNYVIPPGIERVQQLSNNGVNLLQNEQSISLQLCQLPDGESRSIFKSTNFDFRQYNRIRMFMHAESRGKIDNLKDDQLYAVIRFGTDFINNYYEVRMPLKVTKWGAGLKDVEVWPTANEFDLNLEELVKFKVRRGARSVLTPYKEDRGNGIEWGVMGNPNLGEVRGFLLGIENKKGDDAAEICAEVWLNELRLSGLDEKGGWAATGRLDIQLADLGSLTVSGAARSIGFGTIEQRVNERSRDFFTQLDVSTNLQLGKLLPKSAGLEIPFYASYSQTISDPEYDPYDQDVKFSDKIENVSNKDSVKQLAQDFVSITTINVTNLRKNKTNDSKPRIYDISNFDLSYSYTKTEKRSPLIESDELEKHYAGLGYNFAPQPNFIEPFKKLIKYRSRWWNVIKEFNFNLKPSLLSFRADLTRQFGATRAREVQIPGVPSSPFKIPETYDKYFIFDRVYNLRWDLTRSINVDFSATNNARVDEPSGRINTKEKQDSILSNLLKGGRNVVYRQNANASYNLPLTKIPALDWTTLRFNYSTTYNWIGASRVAVDLGNTIENSVQYVYTGQLDFSRLYAKSKWLRALENTGSALDKSSLTSMLAKLNPKDTIGKSKRYIARLIKRLNRQEAKQNKTFEPQWSNVARVFGNLFTSIKSININYTQTYNSRIPGFTDNPSYVGNNWGSDAPGLDYVFGRQPDIQWLETAGQKGWLTKNKDFNFMFTQSYKEELKLEASVQPFRDFIIDVNLSRSLSKNYTSLFKDTIGNGNFVNLNPYTAGGFDMSFVAFQTLFQSYSATSPSEAFQKFEANRLTLSQRLGGSNPYTNNLQQADGYYKGYGRYSQDVLIPAFIAAYTNEDPSSVGLVNQSDKNIDDNPFRKFIPLPNWRLTYNGLTRVPAIEKLFTNLSITHGYTGNLSMNNFASALLYADAQGIGFPSFIDSVSGNYVPFFLVPNVSITEKFAPLIGVDMQLTNQVTLKFDYGQSRTTSLSLVDFQVSEVRSIDITFGLGWRKRGLRLPFKIPFTKGTKKLENDISFRFDLTYRDNAISNNILDQKVSIPTGGQQVLNLNPSIDYVLNNRIRLRLFMEQSRVIGYIATPPPIVNTRAGLQINISLAQ